MTTKQTVRALLREIGRGYAEQAGIRLADKPARLYRLLLTSGLLPTRISADIAVAAAAELVRAGMGTPARMRAATWQQRVNALGRAHYERYDESPATALGAVAELMRDDYRDDLRRLRERADRDPNRIRELLIGFPRLGPVGAQLFCRDTHAVWPELRPAVDGMALDGARAMDLPTDPDELAAQVRPGELAAPDAAPVRVALDRDLAERVRGVV